MFVHETYENDVEEGRIISPYFSTLNVRKIVFVKPVDVPIFRSISSFHGDQNAVLNLVDAPRILKQRFL